MSMDQNPNQQAGETGEPIPLPDVATEPHPVPGAFAPQESGTMDALQDVLPEITRLAQRVGGYHRLAEIAEQLGRAGK
jgi:hypothetical protein